MAVSNQAVFRGAGTSLNVTIGASGNDRALLLVQKQSRNPLSLGSATFDGDSPGTAILTVTSGTALTERWFLILDADLPASGGTYAFATSALTGSASNGLAAFYAEGVAQTAASDTDSSTSNTGDPLTLTLDAAASGAWCVGASFASQNTTHAPADDVTEAYDEAFATAVTCYGWGGHSVLTNVIGFDASGTATRVFGAVSLDPADTGGAASITSVTGDGADTVRAGEEFTIAGTGFEASQGAGTVVVGGVAVDSYTSWSDTSIVAVAPTDGRLFGGSLTITVTPDSNTADDITGQTYLPPTGHDYMTFDSGGVSGMTAESVGWNSATEAPYENLTAGDQYYYETTAIKVDGAGDPVDPEVTATAVLEEGTGNFSVTDVTEPGDYKITGYFRDGDGTDTALSVIFDSTAPSGYTASWDQASITDANHTAASFTFADAEVGATYEYTITSSGGGTPVTGTGTISTATDQITGIDVSGLGDGTLTLSVKLADTVGNEGTAATDTVGKDAIEGGTIVPPMRLHIGIGIFI